MCNPMFGQTTEYLGDFDRRGAVDEPTAEIYLRASVPRFPIIHLHSLAIYSWTGQTQEFKKRDLKKDFRLCCANTNTHTLAASD